MKKTLMLLSVLAVFIALTSAEAAYRVYLKNGFTISGVEAYVKSGGEIRFHYGGGVVAVPENEVLRIEEYRALPRVTTPEAEEAPPPEASEAPAPETPQGLRDEVQAERLKSQLERVEGRLGEIREKEEELASTEQEYDRIRLRIELLFQQGRKAALAAGQTQAQWHQFLPERERQWAQMNSIKKNELEARLEELRAELEPLQGEKESLLEQKRELEEAMGRLGG
jgi:hypothetical protein